MDARSKIWIYGKHAVIAALSNKCRKIYKLFITSETYRQIEHVLKKRKHSHIFITNKELDNLFKKANHQGVALQTSSILHYNINKISDKIKKQQSLILILDQLTDVQNIGNIIRSAHAFNVDAIIAPKNKSFSETPALAKTSCGAIEHVPVILVTNLVSTIKLLKDKGYWVLGLDSRATECLHKFEFTPKTAFIIGAEGSGLRELTQKNCDLLLKIAINESAESINASNASAIAMYSYTVQLKSSSFKSQ
ncbi:MAG: 23S rRNA (guanosine(2251)-2'-O)-methyltransferase RlmB [Rickettsiales bacterium]|nr:23S rRNA (guanosine(2251)-2'-O)-methyltransferase RlmB [Rickettsiales bacterium]